MLRNTKFHNRFHKIFPLSLFDTVESNLHIHNLLLSNPFCYWPFHSTSPISDFFLTNFCRPNWIRSLSSKNVNPILEQATKAQRE
jgi:hypothetical protein